MFLEVQTKHELHVDTTRVDCDSRIVSMHQLRSRVSRQGGMLLINFDILFSALPCSVLSLDAMDVSGEVIYCLTYGNVRWLLRDHKLTCAPQHELDVVRDVYKRQVGRDGVPYGDVISQVIGGFRHLISSKPLVDSSSPELEYICLARKSSLTTTMPRSNEYGIRLNPIFQRGEETELNFYLFLAAR